MNCSILCAAARFFRVAEDDPNQLTAPRALFPHQTHTREQLADLLWPDAEPEAARTNLRTAPDPGEFGSNPAAFERPT